MLTRGFPTDHPSAESTLESERKDRNHREHLRQPGSRKVAWRTTPLDPGGAQPHYPKSLSAQR